MLTPRALALAALALLAAASGACAGSGGPPSALPDAALDASPPAARDDAESGAPSSHDAGPADASSPAGDAAPLAPGASPPEGSPPYDPQDGLPQPDICTRCGACVERLAVAPALHVAGGVRYDSVPPAGGAHDPCWFRYGVHQAEVPDERWVHNLEHGAVVFLHHCDDCADEVAALESYTASQPIALSSPYAALPARFAAVAWGARIVSDCYDPDAFAQFFDAYSKRAPEATSAPPPASCPP